MAQVKRTRTAQPLLVAEYVINYNDGVANMATLTSPLIKDYTNAPVTDFGSQVLPQRLINETVWTANANSGSTYFEMFQIPENAILVGGDMQVEKPFVGPSTVTLAIGDVNSGALYLAATTLLAAAWTNEPTNITNAGTNPQIMTITNSTANGITAVGQIIAISGCTGASAAYNGNYVVDTYSATGATCTNANLTASLTLAGTPAATWIAPKTALNIPGEETNQGGYDYVISQGTDAAAGASVIGTLAMTGGQAATQGRVRVRITFTVEGRADVVL